ncbi:MAG TPA: hypothetical protein VGI39_33360 [Polyangiaceae bacterium]|jgi:hypothetical protein
MTKKTKVSKTNASVHATSPIGSKPAPGPTPIDPVLTGIADAPAQNAPLVPVGFDPEKMKLGRSRSRVSVSIVGHATAAASEMQASITFAEDFGPRLSPSLIAKSLQRAVGWRAALGKARAWDAYIAYGDGKAWEVAFADLARLRLAYDYLLKLDPNAGQRYPMLEALFAAVSAPATKAGKTRKANRDTKAQAEAQGLQIVEPAKKGGKVKAAQPAAKPQPALPAAPPAASTAAESAPPPVTTGNA